MFQNNMIHVFSIQILTDLLDDEFCFHCKHIKTVNTFAIVLC